jgi:hypothetical protein
LLKVLVNLPMVLILSVIYFISFAVYHLNKTKKKEIRRPLTIDVVYKPINKGEYVDFEEIN